MPKTFRGVEQRPMSGVSMRYSFDSAKAKTRKKRQYYAMLGTRGIWENGWKAAAIHAPLSGTGNFDKDQWELYHVDEDRSESKDLAKKYPKRLAKLIDVWFEEAEKNLVLPLDDRSAVELLGTERPQAEGPRTRFVYYPDTAPVPEGVAANVRGRSYKILADVEITDGEAEGVIFAHGSRFGGHSLFIKDSKLYYVYNFLGIEEQKFVSDELTSGKRVLGFEFIRESAGKHGESIGKAMLYVDDKVVAKGPLRTQAGKFTLAGDGLCIGRDSGDNVSQEYETPGTFKGGKILGVGIDVGEESYLNLETLAAGAFARD
jgi:arylsulfatase